MMGPVSSGKPDAETGLGYFVARYLSSAQGPFTSIGPSNVQHRRLNAIQRTGARLAIEN